MVYKRQIAYLDLMEEGIKKGNAGFCKWENSGKGCTLSVSVSNLSGNLSEKVKIYADNNRPLGEVHIQNGRAEVVLKLEGSETDSAGRLGKLRIPLSVSQELHAEFPVAEMKLEKRMEDQIEKYIEKQPQMDPEGQTELRKEEELKKGSDSVNESYEEKEPETVREVECAEEVHTSRTLWESFAFSHEKIRPFGTEAEYYRIVPEDIYQLREEYHILRNNPFLLHGYYNYHYLILGKKDARENEFWLGVPGIYHEREKMAARMYGFEKFEGAKQEYRVGDLGYYLISAM